MPSSIILPHIYTPATHVSYDVSKSEVAVNISAIMLLVPSSSYIEEAITNLPCMFPMATEMPCGNVVTFNGREDVPRTTTPRLCGDPTHYNVLIRDVRDCNVTF